MEMMIADKKILIFHLVFILKFVLVISNKPYKKFYNKLIQYPCYI